MKQFISTDQAPAAIGTYSQAVSHGGVLYISGQIPLVPESMTLVGDDIVSQIDQVFRNLKAVCETASVSLNDVIKFNVYLTDLSHFPKVNSAMEALLTAPYPARAVVEVSKLPKDVQIEIDAIVALD